MRRGSILTLLAVFVFTALLPPAVLGQDPPIPTVEDRDTPAESEESLDATLVREVEPIPIDLPSNGGATAGGEPVDASVQLRPPAEDAGGPPSTRSEVPDQRGENSRTFAETDGSFTAEYSDARLNFQNASGGWVPLDLALRATADGTYDLEVVSLDRQVRFATDGAEAAMAAVSSERGTISSPSRSPSASQRS